MKMNTIPNLLECLQSAQPEISMEPDLIEKSKLPIERMLQWSN